MTRLQELRRSVERFWLRPYASDVEWLNGRIGHHGISAGLQHVPPSVLTGDPFSLTPGECIAVVGINPAFPGREGDVEHACSEHARKNFEEHSDRRAQFFSEADPFGQYNDRHFNRIGNRLGKCFFDPPIEDARAVFRENVLMLDLLPWWSVNADGISPLGLTTYLRDDSPENPLRDWKSLFGLFFEVFEPTSVIINGSMYYDLAEALLETRLVSFQWGTTPTGRRRLARRGIMGNGVPILMHAHLSCPGSPCSDELYNQLLTAWRNQNY